MCSDYPRTSDVFFRGGCTAAARRELEENTGAKKNYPTSVLKGKGSKSRYSTSLIHREYGGGGGTRIDAVIFSSDDVN